MLSERQDILSDLYQTLEPQIDVRKARENANRVSCLVQVGENSLRAKMVYDEQPDLEEYNLKRSRNTMKQTYQSRKPILPLQTSNQDQSSNVTLGPNW